MPTNEETNSLNGLMCAAVRAESIAVWVLLTFIDGFQNATNHILGHAIDDSGYTKRPFFMRLVILRDEHSPDRTG